MPLGTTISPETIAAAKARYAALKDAGQSEAAFVERVAGAAGMPDAIPEVRIHTKDTIPGGWYWHGRIAMGDVLRLTNAGGTEGVALLLWRADEPSERLNPPDTIKVQWTARLGKGRVLLSDMGRAMASIVDAVDAPVDAIAGASTPRTNVAKYADATLFNARDHLVKAAAKYGLTPRDVGPVLSVFAPVATDADGRVGWDGDTAFAGRIDIRMEMNVIAAVANCPHPLAPGTAYAPEPVGLEVWRPEPAGTDDLCRTATPEAVRAFENNRALEGGA